MYMGREGILLHSGVLGAKWEMGHAFGFVRRRGGEASIVSKACDDTMYSTGVFTWDDWLAARRMYVLPRQRCSTRNNTLIRHLRLHDCTSPYLLLGTHHMR